MTLSAPIWIVALALAACAPWFVRALSDGLEARVRRRTEALVARALRAAGLEPVSPARRLAGASDDVTASEESNEAEG